MDAARQNSCTAEIDVESPNSNHQPVHDQPANIGVPPCFVPAKLMALVVLVSCLGMDISDDL